MTPMDNIDSGLFADLPNPGAATKDRLYFATDTGQIFVSDGDAWIESSGGGAAVGLYANRPDAATAGSGAQYLATDTEILYVSDGANWYGALAPIDVAAEFDVVYASGPDELTITSLLGFDFTPVVTINYTGNGSGQITSPTFFSVDSPSQITVPNAAFVLNGGTLTQLDFFVGPFVAATWTGSVLLA